MDSRVSKHKRSSSSDPVQRNGWESKLYSFFKASNRVSLNGPVEGKKEHSQRTVEEDSLKHEISQLRKRLHDQILVRGAMEKALSYDPLSEEVADWKPIPCAAKELIKDVAMLELEVVCLERYLLSLYRKAFNERISRPTPKPWYYEVPNQNAEPEKENSVSDSGIHRSHSSLSHRSACSFRMSPRSKAVARAVDSYHSLPLAMLEQAQIDGMNEEDQYPKTPNRISEEMIKCISAVICELADPPLNDEQDVVFSPASFSSSIDTLSTRGQADTTSLQSRDFASFGSYFDHPSDKKEKHEGLTSPYRAIATVRSISRDLEKLEAKSKLKRYRALICQLEDVDPRKLNHEERLAFWINIHNALAMHAILVYGIPRSNLKRVSMTLKAAYNVGGRPINIDCIQSSILGCRVPRPGQWLHFFSPQKTKFKPGDTRQAFAINQPEPLLHFALCMGNSSDPAVRVYEPETVFQELEAAKEEYITSNLNVSRERKIILPKIVESFAKESDICRAGLMEMIELLVPKASRDDIRQCRRRGSRKIPIEWTPHCFEFQFKISTELV